MEYELSDGSFRKDGVSLDQLLNFDENKIEFIRLYVVRNKSEYHLTLIKTPSGYTPILFCEDGSRGSMEDLAVSAIINDHLGVKFNEPWLKISLEDLSTAFSKIFDNFEKEPKYRVITVDYRK